MVRHDRGLALRDRRPIFFAVSNRREVGRDGGTFTIEGFRLLEANIDAKPGGVTEDGEEIVNVEERFGPDDRLLSVVVRPTRGEPLQVSGFKSAKDWANPVLAALANSMPDDAPGAALN